MKRGKSDQEAYDSAAKSNGELLERVRTFDHDLGSASIDASMKKYYDRSVNADTWVGGVKAAG